jgi:FixJ family two-component response regulator
MTPSEMAISPTKASKAPTKATPTVLVVDDESDILELADDAIVRGCAARVIRAGNLREARKIIAREQIQLVIADACLPDGDGTELIQTLKDARPEAGFVLMTGHASVDRSVSAFRSGAIDFLAKPFTESQLTDRVQRAIQFQDGIHRNEQRIQKLKRAVRKLNSARRMVSKKVDLLCNDLVSAYGDLARQFEDVRVREAFRSTINASRDLEQMLCHSMDWILRQCGYTNIAIFLSGDDGTFELGAYMKYTIQGSKPLTEALKQGIIETIAREDFICWSDREAGQLLSDVELDHLHGQGIIGVNASYLGESLGIIVMFRDGKAPFSSEDAATLRTVAPLFAHALTNLARAADGPEKWIEEPGADETGDGGFEDHFDNDSRERDETNDHHDGFWADEPPKKNKPKKQDDADWWKRGEPPPY